MGKSDFEHMLGFHAAPLLTGLRPACLLSFRKSSFEDFEGLLASYRPCFRCHGISTFRLSEGMEHVLLLFYRPALLAKALAEPEAEQLLAECGYKDDEALAEKLDFLRLRMRMRKSFPHEVGLFLGYPPADVRGFIEHKGQGFCCSGYWKVYSNEKETLALFHKFSECTHAFCTQLEQGTAFPELLRAI